MVNQPQKPLKSVSPSNCSHLNDVDCQILNYEFDDISTTCETVLESEINVVENPDVELTSDPAICQAESATVICDIINAATGSTYSHTWSVNEGGLLSGVEPDVAGFVTNPSVGSATPLTVADPDDIVIDCEVVDENGCTRTASVTIEVVATPILEWTTPLPGEVCSPALSCVAVEVINELDPMPEIITLWANPNGGASDNCFLFQNNTLVPSWMTFQRQCSWSMCWMLAAPRFVNLH